MQLSNRKQNDINQGNFSGKARQLTASSYVENNSNVNVEVLWLNCKEDGAIKTERIRVASRITVHLSDGVEAMFSFNGHLSIALMTIGRSTEEVVDTQRTLTTTTTMTCTTDTHTDTQTHTHTRWCRGRVETQWITLRDKQQQQQRIWTRSRHAAV